MLCRTIGAVLVLLACDDVRTIEGPSAERGWGRTGRAGGATRFPAPHGPSGSLDWDIAVNHMMMITRV